MKQEYKYLDKDQSNIIEKFIREYITDKKDKILNNIKSLTLVKLYDVDFNYYQIFDKFIVGGFYINNDNIFYAVDGYCKDNDLHYSAPPLRNTMSLLFKSVYIEFCKEYKFKSLLDKKVIDLIQQNFYKSPSGFKDFYDSYDTKFSNKVYKYSKLMVLAICIVTVLHRKNITDSDTSELKSMYLKLLKDGDKFNTTIIKYFEECFYESQSLFLKFYHEFENIFDDDIVYRCRWMLVSKKYNVIFD
jgi:hypothetical protein